jgi:hypothetical protein
MLLALVRLDSNESIAHGLYFSRPVGCLLHLIKYLAYILRFICGQLTPIHLNIS